MEKSKLSDLSIEQVFLRSDPGSEGRSSLFTVRTSETRLDRVREAIEGPMSGLLEQVFMKVKIDPQKPEQAAELVFWKEKDLDPTKFKKDKNALKDLEGHASTEQVRRLLNEVLNPPNSTRQITFSLERKAEDRDKDGRYSRLTLYMTEPYGADNFKKLVETVAENFNRAPQPERLENFDPQLASSTQDRAMYAIVASWAAILLYLWFRFGNWTFGAAAVLCLIHDVCFTLGCIAAAHYVHQAFGSILGVQDFKIDLASVAAILTLVGYSVNDTIVVFDRIREVRGKNPLLTFKMINDSINQTLSRTVLASMTVFLVVVVLYFFGGEGVKLFAFTMVVGVVVGTFSSIYVASPLLLVFGEGSPESADTATRTKEMVEKN